MRVAFAGTPPFAARAFEAILDAGHEVPLVLTQPDRPAGRGLRLASSAVAQLAERRSIPTLKPASLRGGDAALRLRELAPDVMVVAAYGLILPPEILAIPRFGCLNIHASLLPRWRGAAPIQRAILAGDAETGVGIMQMDAGLDTGDVLLEKRVAIAPTDTAGTLTRTLADLGASAIVEALANLTALVPRKQDAGKATYAPKVAKPEARIDWKRSSAEIDRHVRAFNPVPGAEGQLGGESVKVWTARLAQGSGEPGQVISGPAGPLIVACGSGALQIDELQRPGGKRLTSAEFLRGRNKSLI